MGVDSSIKPVVQQRCGTETSVDSRRGYTAWRNSRWNYWLNNSCKTTVRAVGKTGTKPFSQSTKINVDPEVEPTAIKHETKLAIIFGFGRWGHPQSQQQYRIGGKNHLAQVVRSKNPVGYADPTPTSKQDATAACEMKKLNQKKTNIPERVILVQFCSKVWSGFLMPFFTLFAFYKRRP